MAEEKKEFKKIPESAKCVFKGVLHEVWQWEQEQFDGSFKTFECLKRRDNVDIIATTKDKMIIVNFEEQPNRAPKICIPCGGSDEGESLLDAARRELVEETGYVSNDWSQWQCIDALKYSKLEWNVQYFIARNCEKRNQPHLDGGEKIVVKLFTFDEFIKVSQEDNFSQKEIKVIAKEILENDIDGTKRKEFERLLFGE